MERKRQEKDYIRGLARSLYWGYSKELTGEGKRLAELGKDEQKIWTSMARRAIRRVEELDAAAAKEGTA